jgi:hypothetical protein
MVAKSSAVVASKSPGAARKPEARSTRESGRVPTSSSAAPQSARQESAATARSKQTPAQARQANAKDAAKRPLARKRTRVGLASAGGAASRVVEQAASILEEEIARGIVAAQEVERRFIDVGSLRGEDPNHVMQRFRRDAHDLVDILIDLVHVSARTLGRAITLEAGSRPALPEGKNGVREMVSIDLPGPVLPGKTAEVSLTLTNSDPEDTPPFTFNTLGLVSSGGAEIGPELVRFEPEQVVIEAEGEVQLKVLVTIPSDTAPGRYTGLLQSTHLDRLCATLSVDVAKDE